MTELALRMHVPSGVIGATLVALGTSLPELSTAISSATKGHTEVALGNVIGADILNILSVTGISLSAAPQGFSVGSEFFKIFFPLMLLILFFFHGSVYASKNHVLGKPHGAVLIGLYIIGTVIGYLLT